MARKVVAAACGVEPKQKQQGPWQRAKRVSRAAVWTGRRRREHTGKQGEQRPVPLSLAPLPPPPPDPISTPNASHTNHQERHYTSRLLHLCPSEQPAPCLPLPRPMHTSLRHLQAQWRPVEEAEGTGGPPGTAKQGAARRCRSRGRRQEQGRAQKGGSRSIGTRKTAGPGTQKQRD